MVRHLKKKKLLNLLSIYVNKILYICVYTSNPYPSLSYLWFRKFIWKSLSTCYIRVCALYRDILLKIFLKRRDLQLAHRKRIVLYWGYDCRLHKMQYLF